MKTKFTNFPQEGEDKTIDLRNSDHETFDYEYALELRKSAPAVWNLGGKKNGNAAFENWTKYRADERTSEIEEWIKQREAYLSKNKSKEKLASVIAIMKWGGVCDKGAVYMKDLIQDEVKRRESKDMNKTINTKALSEREILEKKIKDAQANGTEMPISHKLFSTEVKKMEDGSYRFVASDEIRDSDEEIVAIDGVVFTRYAKNPVWIWGHRMSNGDPYDVIGRTEDWQKETAEAATTRMTFSPVYARHKVAQDIKEMHEDGIATAISIGFRVVEYDFDTRTITKSELYEVSNVIVPANENAVAYAAAKGLISDTEQKKLINEKLLPINKKKLGAYRDLFLGKELLGLLGYEVEGKEIKDMRNVYDLILEKLKTPDLILENQEDDEPTPPTVDKGITVGEAQEYFKEKLSNLFAR